MFLFFLIYSVGCEIITDVGLMMAFSQLSQCDNYCHTYSSLSIGPLLYTTLSVPIDRLLRGSLGRRRNNC
jgi:hypothetical protein